MLFFLSRFIEFEELASQLRGSGPASRRCGCGFERLCAEISSALRRRIRDPSAAWCRTAAIGYTSGMEQKVYITTVQIAICAKSSRQAERILCDALPEFDSEGILDWQYLQIGGQDLTPTVKCITDVDHLEEGDIFQV